MPWRSQTLHPQTVNNVAGASGGPDRKLARRATRVQLGGKKKQKNLEVMINHFILKKYAPQKTPPWCYFNNNYGNLYSFVWVRINEPIIDTEPV